AACAFSAAYEYISTASYIFTTTNEVLVLPKEMISAARVLILLIGLCTADAYNWAF
ncbi:hypothetical protein Tco_0447394, partial [Tanacetum coccineum]